MHGTIFAELKQFVTARLGDGAWERLLETAGLGLRVYLPIRAYPDEELNRIVMAASETTGIAPAPLLEQFGLFIAPHLLAMYRSLLRPEWKTLDVVEHAESTAHRAVRLQQPEATPPYLQAERTGPNQVTVRYTSKRKLCFVAKGIVQGLAAEFDEPLRIAEPECMHRGGEACILVLTTG
jgi:predicted hydrocarbon binding protein